MAELTSQDRLQPSLLDRLLDQEPGKRSEAREQRVLTRAQLRAAVLRDLGWLFNATRAEPDPKSEDLHAEAALWQRHDEARKSVLNFGLPAISGVTVASLDLAQIEGYVREAVLRFEPRINAQTLHVEVQQYDGSRHNTMQLIIRGQMWAQPVPLELMLSAQVDVETGDAVVRDLRA
jgi:type VI secretion system protein ImpF